MQHGKTICVEDDYQCALDLLSLYGWNQKISFWLQKTKYVIVKLRMGYL